MAMKHLAFAAALLLAGAPVTAQVTRVVDDDGRASATSCDDGVPAHRTPAAALAVSSHGDTVLVCPGIYVGQVDFLGKAIVLRSVAGPVVTVLDGARAGSVVRFSSGEGRGSVLEGFTVRNGEASWGAGITISTASPVVRANLILHNRADSSGGGIASGGGSPLIEGNTIASNRAGFFGGGINLADAGSPVVRHNLIAENVADFEGGGLRLLSTENAVVQHNLIRGNAAKHAGGILLSGDGNISGNLIVRNRAAVEGGGAVLSVTYAQAPLLVNNTLAENDSPLGSGIFAESGPGSRVINNIVSASAGQAAVSCDSYWDDASRVFQSNNVFSATGPAFDGSCSDKTGLHGNISADPLFADPAADDFHLLPGSPNLDSGDNVAASALAIDWDGHARLVDGDGDAQASVDIGADEAPALDPAGVPGPFGKAVPWNGGYGLPTTGPVSWSPSTGAAGYEYCFDTVDNGRCDGAWTPAWTAIGATLVDLDSVTMYYWQVRAQNAAGATYADGASWASWRFATAIGPPRPFGKISPTYDSGWPGPLRWAAARGAERYEYCLATAANNRCDTTWTPVGSRTDTTISGLVGFRSYYWQVRAVNAAGVTEADEGSYWPLYSGCMPDGFALLAPADGAHHQPTTLVLDWEDTYLAEGYRYCVDTIDNGLCDTGWTDAGIHTRVTLGGLRRVTTYYWMVEAVNAVGATRADGGSWSFTTGVGRATAPTPPQGRAGSGVRPGGRAPAAPTSPPSR